MTENELGSWGLVVFHLGYRVGAKGLRTPLPPPSPGVSLSSAAERMSSFCNMIFLSTSILFVVGSAYIHFCITVQIFGAGFSGVIELLFSKGVGCVGGDCASGISMSSLTTACLPTETIGSIACHCANRYATPRQTASLVKSSDVHTLP